MCLFSIFCTPISIKKKQFDSTFFRFVTISLSYLQYVLNELSLIMYLCLFLEISVTNCWLDGLAHIWRSDFCTPVARFSTDSITAIENAEAWFLVVC